MYVFIVRSVNSDVQVFKKGIDHFFILTNVIQPVMLTRFTIGSLISSDARACVTRAIITTGGAVLAWITGTRNRI